MKNSKQHQKRVLQEMIAADEKDGMYDTPIQSWYAAKTNRKVEEFDEYDQHICNVVEQYLEDEEEKMFRNGEVVSSFMAHCEENGLEIPLSFYESYFGA